MMKRNFGKAKKPVPSVLSVAVPQPPSVPAVSRAQPATKPSPATVPPKPAEPYARVVFACHAPNACRVSVCGDFNAWSPEAEPMDRREGGIWQKSLTLPPGRYHYKFVADGQWMHDPSSREKVPNEHGSLNSVIEVQA